MRLHLAFWSVAGVAASSIALAQVPPTDPEPTEPAGATPEAPPEGSAAASASAAPTAVPPVPSSAPAPAETASAPPPVAPAAVAPPAVAPAAAPVEDSGADERSEAPPPELTLALELDGGLGARLGSSSDYGFSSGERSGLVFGPSAWLAPSRLWAFGVGYERSSLGSDSTQPTLGAISVQRELDAVWLGGRAFPWRTDSMGIFVAIGVGVSWQHLQANGTRVTEGSIGSGSTFDCSGSDGPGLAIGGGIGLDVDLDRNLAFVTQLGAAGHRHTSDTLDACAPGSGTLSVVSGRIGFAYRFDLDEPSAKQSARAR